MIDNIMVSIICIAYNHEKYIRDALDGFVMQKTDFAFEVLIHDDASTDSTASIIREYEARYPDVIKPIYQTENQYQQGISVISTYLAPRISGKYAALCEGDDYWTDDSKLQRQVDFLEAHPEIDGCAHRVMVKGMSDHRSDRYVAPADHDGILSLDQVISGGGGFVATNSLVFRSDLYDKRYKFTEILTLDYIHQIRISIRGGMYYMDRCMGVYRYMTDGSWSVRMSKNLEKYIRHTQKVIQALEQLDVDLDYRCHDTIVHKIARNQCGIVVSSADIRMFLEEPYRSSLHLLSFPEQCQYWWRAWKHQIRNFLKS